jgi:hypothetical protein
MAPPSWVSKNKRSKKPAWRGGRNIHPKCQLKFNALHGFVFQNKELFITSAVRTSNPQYSQLCGCCIKRISACSLLTDACVPLLSQEGGWTHTGTYTFLGSASKVYAGDHRRGLRHDRSNLLFRQILHTKWEYSETVHQLFLDLKKAYDSVRREVLYNILTEFGVPMKLSWSECV